MLTGFKDFITRGNVVDLAVAVVIGAAFATIVDTVVSALVQPILAAVGGPDASGLGFAIREGNEATFVDIGAVINAMVVFLITAAVVYAVFVVPMNRLAALRARGEEPESASPAEDVVVLREIRDLLAHRDQG
ncbi:large conductance mechanosensitive channel protein MscL [Ornithinimicrobium sediminis]|uniref:large conductance mechanosensitive channel protein MscL n=1 Tax=Ornithinimicrobium sediminis TaxID=2904603 RepID=UPI001E5BC7EA|nr:large conductance mechanosensitive channel protein MscL [Ornithinimicrobium sediminis]MCE0485686.1 large conductance mechanosensitive channel protein MscL [Ornithinimicrobium sediminis]